MGKSDRVPMTKCHRHKTLDFKKISEKVLLNECEYSYQITVFTYIILY